MQYRVDLVIHNGVSKHFSASVLKVTTAATISFESLVLLCRTRGFRDDCTLV
jgi:hypothetical protein